MHVLTLYQLVADRRDELAAMADSHQARQRSARRALPAAEEDMTRRERRALLRIPQLAR
jgi:hypothetical protein